MIEMINALTGTRMAVAPEREAEYLAAGHTRVLPPPAAPEPAPPPAKKKPPANRAAGK